jgi:hypothetical protein
VWLAGADRYGARVAAAFAVMMMALAAIHLTRAAGRWRMGLVVLGTGSIVALAMIRP